VGTAITLYSIAITLGAYFISRIVARKYPSPFTTPVFFSTTVIILLLSAGGISYAQYEFAKEIMTFLLGPATVALAVPLYKNRETLLRNSMPAIIGLIIGSLSTMLAAIFIVKLFHLSDTILSSISVKSVTVPIAVEVSKIINGDPALAAAFVVATGTIGTMLGPWLLDKTRISDPLSRGLALGTIAHGQGTAQAALEGELQGAIGGVAMGLGAIFTSFAAPLLVPLLR
jgi:predicted murein hydrolase (TIGR00659 family)